MRASLRRGVWTGLLYGASYFVIEFLGLVAFFHLVGMGSGRHLIELLARSLGPLFIEYCLFGGALGVMLALPVGRIETRLPRRWRGPSLNLTAMTAAVAVLVYGGVSESPLPRYLYLIAGLSAQGLIVVLWLFVRLARWILLRSGLGRVSWLGTPGRVSAAAAVLLIAGAGYVVFQGLRPERRSPQSRTAARAPNVLLLVVDTLRRDHVSAYGYGRKTTPNLDVIAKEGALYERAYSPAPWTLPAHASLFTGLHSSTHETYLGQIRLGPEKRTLAETLQAHGYRTGCFAANPWISSITGLDQGFDRFDSLGVQVTADETFLLNLLTRHHGLDLGAALITERLLQWVKAVHRQGDPFFAFANYMEVHEPYGTVPEPYFSAFLREPLPRSVGKQWLRESPLFLCSGCPPASSGHSSGDAAEARGLFCSDGRWRVKEPRLEQIESLYDAGIAYVDDHIGRIYRTLQQDGILDDTLLIVTSDHGESLGERGQIGHNVFLYNSILEIPLVIRFPKLFPPGLRIRRSVSLLDIFPTVEAAVGIESSGLKDCVSLVPSDALLGLEDRVLAEYFPAPPDLIRRQGKIHGCDFRLAGFRRGALQRDGVKYIWSSGGDHELYDLAADPVEEHNLIADRPQLAQALDAELRSWLRSLQPQHSDAQHSELDPVTKKALEALGYVQ